MAGDVEIHARKVPDPLDAGCDKQIGSVLCLFIWHRDARGHDALPANRFYHIGGVPDGDVGHNGPDQAGIAVKERHQLEPGVSPDISLSERASKLAHSNKSHRFGGEKVEH